MVTINNTIQNIDKSEKTYLIIIGDTNPNIWGGNNRDRLRKLFAKYNVIEKQISEIANDDHVIIIRDDVVIERPLIPAILNKQQIILKDTIGNLLLVSTTADQYASAVNTLGKASETDIAPELQEQFAIISPEMLGVDFWQDLRKKATPYATIINANNRKLVEWKIFMGTYKGATDFVTKYIWPWPAFYITSFLANKKITPNMVTSLSAIFTILAFFLFMEAYWGLGLVCAWLMTFLDTVDGKLARTTLTSSKFGDIFDHGIDLIHPPFWYVAWGMGLFKMELISWNELLLYSTIITSCYIGQRIIEGLAIKFLKIEIHIWRPFDTFFREITARRNPNMVILTAFIVFGAPYLGFIIMTFWIVACFFVHIIQIFQAFNEKKKLGALTSWLVEPKNALEPK